MALLPFDSQPKPVIVQMAIKLSWIIYFYQFRIVYWRKLWVTITGSQFAEAVEWASVQQQEKKNLKMVAAAI